MSMEQHLSRLKVPHAAVQLAAVAAAFAEAGKPGVTAAARDGAIAVCLGCDSKAAVEASVRSLLQLVARGALPAAAAQDQLLTALSVAGPATAVALAGGLLQAFEQQLGATPPGTWRSHPLSRALLCNAASAQPLVLGVSRLLARAGGAAPSAEGLLPALRPFLLWVLVDPALAAQQPLLGPQLRGTLARLACCSASPALQHGLLQLLAACLPAAGEGAGSGAEAALTMAVAELAEVVENCAEEPDAALVSDLVACLVGLCREAAQAQRSSLAQQLAAALARLADSWPQVVLAHAADLGALLLLHPGSGAALGAGEATAVLALQAQLLRHAVAHPSGAGGAELAALLTLPLLQQVAFGGSREAKQWAGHSLTLLQQLRQRGDGAADGALVPRLLLRLWSGPLEARHWLASLRLALREPGGGTTATGPRPARDRQQLDGGALLVLCALVQHPTAPVRRAALSAAVTAMEATSLLGPSLLPLLVQQLQQQVELCLSGKVQRPSRQLLDLLRALPEAGHHPAALPFVLRTLQPLLGPGFAAPGTSPGLPLRVARAECLRDIAADDPDKAAELVGLVQACLADEAPAVQAAGLDCVAALCEADVLEFYAAWRVVHRALPRLPGHPAVAAAWVRLLGYGGLDAAVQPQAAATIVDALWLAAGDEAPQVRRQAYASLAAFQFSTLEEMGALRPLASHAALLRAELRRQGEQEQGAAAGASARRRRQAAEHAAAECEELVRAALAHEHATRRRPGASGGASGTGRERSAAAAGGGATTLVHRLTSVLPKQLLGGAAVTPSDLLQRLPELAPSAVLYLYAPPPPGERTGRAAAAAARQAAAAYQAVFAEVVRQQASAGAAAAEDAAAAAELLAAWQPFLRRWLAAERAAAQGGQATDQRLATVQAALQLWAAVKQQLAGSGGSPAAAANAAWAAAALCCSTPQPVPALVAAVRLALQEAAAPEAQLPAAARRASLAALGAVAEAVRVALGADVLQAATALIADQLSSPEPSPVDAAAAVTGLGLSCRALGSSPAIVAGDASAALPDGADAVLRAGVGRLLGVLCVLWPAAGGALQQAAVACRIPFYPASAAVFQACGKELLLADAHGLAAALPAAGRALELGSLLQQLHTQLVAQLPTTADAGMAAALCTLLSAVNDAGLSAGCLTDSQIGESLRLLMSVGRQAVSPADGRLAGAAAEAAGTLLSAALQRGFTPSAPEEQPAALLQSLLALPRAASQLPYAVPAKRGAAAGIAALLVAPAVDPAGTQYKDAVSALEELALRSADRRSRLACAQPLAAVCYATRQGGGPAGGSIAADAGAGGSGGAAAAGKGLSQLAPDGALRPLLEALLEGRWALPDDGQEGGATQGKQPAAVSAAEAAAVLRCLASAERLPALNYGAACRRLLRVHSEPAAAAEEVEAAVVAFVSAQGSRQQQQYHLADLAAELVGRCGLAAAAGASQRRLLRCLPQLLQALPEAQAVSALQAVCRRLGGAGGGAPAALLLPLLQAVEQLLGGGSGAGPSGLQQAAQQAAGELLLPLLPAPGEYPLRLTAGAQLADEHGVEQLLSGQQRCWAAMLGCLRKLPRAQLEALLQRRPLLQQLPLHAAYATAALVADGGLEARALQHPRNLLLDAGSGRDDAGSLSRQQQGRLAAFVARAVACLPVAQQQQWLLDILEASRACLSPHGALLLAASLAAGLAAAAVDVERRAADHATCACPGDAVLDSLPRSLHQLLDSQAWRHGGTQALLLQRLAAALQGMGVTQIRGEAAPLDGLLRRCLVSARHSLTPDLLALLASLL